MVPFCGQIAPPPIPPSPQLVQLLGIAQRQIHIKFDQNQRPQNSYNPLPINIETVGGWIKFNRIQKNLTRGHVAAKMGIAQAVVRSWEIGKNHPDSNQLRVLADIFGVDPAKEIAFAALVSAVGNTDALHPSR